jgi:alpha-beta hydrolase superfamily lysophospholipase
MTKKHFPIYLTCFGLFLLIGSLVTVWRIDRPLADRQTVEFSASTGDLLVGSYFPGTQDHGVLLLEGFGSDQVTMTSLVSEFAWAGWHVFTFDFSGHGRSPGALAFDNAQTDRLAFQALSALEEFAALSGLRSDQIFVVGHSLGARVALQSATLNPEPVAGVVLLGAQVNLSRNMQSEFFTGTTDTDLVWVQALGPENPNVPILMLSGKWDDILTPESAGLLYERLGAENASAPRKLVLLPTLVHNYEPFSPRIMEEMMAWLPDAKSTSSASWRILAWIFGLAGLLLAQIGGKAWVEAAWGPEQIEQRIELSNQTRFLWGKLLLWLGALPVAAILGSLFFFTPIPVAKPVFNLIYVGFIGGYGLLLLILYWRGKMPGAKGRLPFTAGKTLISWRRVLAALGIAAGMLVLTAAYARTGWFIAPPAGVRFTWLVIFVPFTALGFWIGQAESRIFHAAGAPFGSRLALTLIGLFPFFVYTILMAALGSISGMIGGLQGLLILWLVLAFGDLLQAVGRNPWLTAVCMAVQLYWLILPQGVLFG